MSGIPARVGSVVRTLVRRWESIQVELHGIYAVERFTSMQKYCEIASFWRAFGMLATAPLPPLICAAIIDAVPLESPILGFEHSATVWVRGFLAGFIQSYALSWIFCHYVSELQISKRVLVLTSALASITIHAMVSLLAMVWCYPLSFSVLWVSGPWIFTLAVALYLVRGQFLRENTKVLQEVRRFAVVFMTQTSTVLVYTALNVIFVSVPVRWQPTVALIAPIFKITQKNVLRRILRGRDDVLPEMTIFSIDISSAFFVSSTMQRETSVNTSILLVMIDLGHLMLSLCDLMLMLKSLEGIAAKLRISTAEAVNAALAIATKCPEVADRGSATDSLTQSKADFFYVYHRRNTIKNPTKIGPRLTQIAPMPVARKAGGIPDSSSGNSGILPKGRYAVERDANTMERISRRERYLLLDKVLRILFFTEFILLTEFIEVFTPVMYSLYLVILFYWPNRQFYPQFDGVDEAQFWKNICITLVYALSETGSFALLVLVISRTTHKYPLQQLAYAIKISWGQIQGKLLIWIIALLQSSVLQMGTDYTFKFEWIPRS